MATRKLQIGKVGSRWFKLPLDTVTSTLAVLAIRGSGKTYTAGVLAEEMLKAGLHIVILDPEDAWWGLRSSAKGNKAGYPIIVFGGENADIPIEAGSARVVVDMIVEVEINNQSVNVGKWIQDGEYWLLVIESEAIPPEKRPGDLASRRAEHIRALMVERDRLKESYAKARTDLLCATRCTCPQWGNPHAPTCRLRIAQEKFPESP